MAREQPGEWIFRVRLKFTLGFCSKPHPCIHLWIQFGPKFRATYFIVELHYWVIARIYNAIAVAIDNTFGFLSLRIELNGLFRWFIFKLLRNYFLMFMILPLSFTTMLHKRQLTSYSTTGCTVECPFYTFTSIFEKLARREFLAQRAIKIMLSKP